MWGGGRLRACTGLGFGAWRHAVWTLLWGNLGAAQRWTGRCGSANPADGFSELQPPLPPRLFCLGMVGGEQVTPAQYSNEGLGLTGDLRPNHCHLHESDSANCPKTQRRVGQ